MGVAVLLVLAFFRHEKRLTSMIYNVLPSLTVVSAQSMICTAILLIASHHQASWAEPVTEADILIFMATLTVLIVLLILAVPIVFSQSSLNRHILNLIIVCAGTALFSQKICMIADSIRGERNPMENAILIALTPAAYFVVACLHMILMRAWRALSDGFKYLWNKKPVETDEEEPLNL